MLHIRLLSLKFVLPLLAMLFFSSVTSAEETKLTLGNSVGNGVTSLVVSGTEGGSALYYPSSTMQAYVGCKIASVQVAFDVKTTDGAVTLFLSNDISGAPFYTQTVDATKRGWNTFELDTPYEIDGKPLYIGYTVRNVRYLRYCTPLVSNEEWIWQKSDGWQKYDGKYSAAILAEVSGANVPRQNVRLGIVDMPKYVVAGQKITYNAIFQNLGAEPVKSLVVTYRKNGEDVKTETVDGLNVEPRREGSFTLGSFSLDEECVAEVSLGVTSVNGEQDAVTDDNWSKTVSTICRNGYVGRKVLLEFFSTEKCTGCPVAHNNIDKLFKDNTDIVEVGHHAGFYTDALTVPESVEYEWFYSEQNKFAPAGMFDRTNRADIYPEIFKYGVPMMDLAKTQYAEALYNSCKKIPALASVNVSAQLNGRSVTVSASGEQLLPVPDNQSLRLFVYLTEDSIYTDAQAGASSGFYHRYSLRKSLTPTWGDEIDLTSGYSKSYSFDIPEDWNVRNMRAVAFVANYDSEDKNNCGVLNSNEVRLDSSASAVKTVDAEVGDGAWTLMNVSGSVISHGEGRASLEGQMNSVPMGLYVVRKGNSTIRVVR